MKRIRNAALYFFVLFLFLTGFYLFQSYSFLVISCFFLLIFMYDTVSLRKMIKNTKITLQIPKEYVVKNNKTGIYVEVENPTCFFSANLYLKMQILNEFYGDKAGNIWNIPLFAKEAETIWLPVEFQKCGKIKIIIEEIKIRGILGILEKKKEIKQEQIFYIYPKGLDWNDNIMEYDGVREVDIRRENEGTKKGSDFAEISDLREYIPGDNIRDIHWKLSAKREILMLKEHVMMADSKQTVLVELADSLVETEEKIEKTLENVLELMCGFLKGFLKKGTGFEVIWWDRRKQELKCMEIQSADHMFGMVAMMFEAGVYKENLLAEQMWKEESKKTGSYLWIGKNEKTEDYKIIVRGQNGVIVKLEE